MEVWYKCVGCQLNVPSANVIRDHILNIHKCHIPLTEVEKLMVKDPEEIQRLRKIHWPNELTLQDDTDEKEHETLRRKEEKEWNSMFPSNQLMPVGYSELKPNKYRSICQYCQKVFNSAWYVAEHTNSHHEMINWYRCFNCIKAFVSKLSLQTHMRRIHKNPIPISMVEIQLITDEEEINRLRCARIKKILSESQTKQDNKQFGQCRPLLMPVKYSEFKPTIDRKLCQYCGYTSQSSNHVLQHVNTQHEMTIWYRCPHCNEAFVSKTSMKNHMLDVHNEQISNTIMERRIITDKDEVDRLRNARIKHHLKLNKMARKEEGVESEIEPDYDQGMELNPTETLCEGIKMENDDGLKDPLSDSTSFNLEHHDAGLIMTSQHENIELYFNNNPQNGGTGLKSMAVKVKRLKLTEDLLEQLKHLKNVVG